MAKFDRVIGGTSAIDLNGAGYRRNVIEVGFPRALHEKPRQATNPLIRFFRRTFERSEMICSLVREDFRGCSIDTVSRRDATLALVVVALLAAVSIAWAA